MTEYAVLEKLLPAMAEIMNAVPGEGFRMQEEDTLLILQRRMEEGQLKEELVTFNEMFALKDACTISKLCEAMLAYFKIKLLVEAKQEKFTPRLERELLKEYDAQRTKITNLLHLSKVNVITADAYQKETIELAMKKNKAFLEAFDIEIAALEERNERQPINKKESDPLQAVKQKKRPISKKLLIELLNHLNGVEYISELEKQGIQIAGKVEKQPFVLEEETKQILDEVFLNMSGLEIYILLKEYGFLGEEIRKQEMDQFVKTETFLRLMDEDKGIRAEQNLIKMAYNKNSKIKKILKSMNGKVNMLDLEGVIEDYLYRKKQEYHIL